MKATAENLTLQRGRQKEIDTHCLHQLTNFHGWLAHISSPFSFDFLILNHFQRHVVGSTQVAVLFITYWRYRSSIRTFYGQMVNNLDVLDIDQKTK